MVLDWSNCVALLSCVRDSIFGSQSLFYRVICNPFKKIRSKQIIRLYGCCGSHVQVFKCYCYPMPHLHSYALDSQYRSLEWWQSQPRYLITLKLVPLNPDSTNVVYFHYIICSLQRSWEIKEKSSRIHFNCSWSVQIHPCSYHWDNSYHPVFGKRLRYILDSMVPLRYPNKLGSPCSAPQTARNSSLGCISKWDL